MVTLDRAGEERAPVPEQRGGRAHRDAPGDAQGVERPGAAAARRCDASNERTVEIPGIPATLEEFLSLRDDIVTTPHGGAAVFVTALVVYSQDEALGLQCLTIAVDGALLSDGDEGYKGKQLSIGAARDMRDRIGAKPYVARSYIQGTSPEDGYALPSGPLTICIKEQPRDMAPERAKVFVHSTCADSPRPIALVPNDRGIWKAREWRSLQVGGRPPAAVVDDDL